MLRAALVAGVTLVAACAATVASAASPDGWDKLVTPERLTALDNVTVVDIRDPAAYLAGHVPGAVNVPYPEWRGPPENPGEVISDSHLTTILQNAGLDHEDRIVITHAGANESDFGAAARVYWTLKSAGFPTLAILNGGVTAYDEAGQPLSVEAQPVEKGTATFTLSDEYAIDREGIAKVISGERSATLVDARPGEFFQGATKHPAASTAGTLKSAQSLPFMAFFEEGETEIAPAERARNASAAVGGDTGEIVSFCNTGHWAAINWFALSELAGKENVKLYPESMVGWVNGGGDAVAGR